LDRIRLRHRAYNKEDQPTKVVLTEQEISVDYIYISESHSEDLYFDTVLIYDPER
jgi:hypothetical protein